MGRLIEDNSVIEIAEKCTFTDENEKKKILDFVRYCVKQSKTAYDVDKFVAEMNEALIKLGDGSDCSRCAFREVCDRGCIETMIEVYKSIARKGGV